MTDPTPSPEPAALRSGHRRRWVLGAMAGAATLAGVGLAWRNERTQAASVGDESGIWQMVFEAPDGTTLRMATFRGKPLVLNFWATWCPPCVEELPLLSRFHAENSNRGWQVLGLAVDQREPVQRFLAQAPVSFPVALAGASGIQLGRSLGNVSGALPFTVVFGPEGEVTHRKIGQVTPKELQSWVSRN